MTDAPRGLASLRRYQAVVVGLATVVVLAMISRLQATPYDNYVRLADAFLHGRLWIDWPGAYIDALEYGGRRYVIEAPLPALLLIPQVVLAGTHANQTLLAVALAGLALGAGWELARRLGTPLGARAWLCGFLLLGTDLAWCASYGDVWFVAHVCAAACTLLALVELVGRRRPWLVALYGVAAMESRFSLVLALPVYAVLLADGPTPRDRLRALARFGATLAPFALAYVAYNEGRWGTPYDVGYAAWYHRDQAGSPTGSPFRLAYLPYELKAFFVRFPDVPGRAPWLVPTYDGVALTWTSPALALAFLARGPRRLVAGLWAATLLVAAPSALYYVDGYAQFGMRHALDFEPFLFALAAIGSRRGIGRTGAVLCAWSIAVGLWGIWFWRAFYRA